MDEAENNRLAELLVELAKGNGQVLAEIDIRMQRILYTVGYPYYKDKEKTKDSIRDLYSVLPKKAKNFRENNSAGAWLVTVYKNFLNSRYRKKKLEKRYVQEEIQLIKTKMLVTIDKELDDQLFWKEIMDRLDDYEKSLLNYTKVGLTVREIAEILDKPKSTVELHLQKLKEKIRNM